MGKGLYNGVIVNASRAAEAVMVAQAPQKRAQPAPGLMQHSSG